jgi:MYXO-CTERM domain-containing protein
MNPACQPSGACGVCSATNATRCSGSTPVCDTSAGVCVGCLSNAQCGDNTPVCDLGSHTCHACGSNADCTPAAPICLPTGACAACTATDTSHCAPATPKCYVSDPSSSGGVCVGCLTGGDCGGITPLCSSSSHACVACNGDGAPSCPNPERPYCLTAGLLAGACSECTATNTTLCNPLEPVCLLDLAICGCAGDQSCGPADSGLVCSGPGGLCEPGCGSAPRNGCPSGQTCATTAADTAGQCTMPNPCASDNDCSAPLSRCDMTSGKCVGCLVDMDCPAPMICDGSGHTCVECTSADKQNCAADLAGAQCLPGGKCGCTQDSDCGGTTSGRVCDPTSSRCVPGCRGTGGNGCNAGETCTSTTSDIGSCNGKPRPDGGSSDGGVTDGSAGGATGDASTGDGAVADGGLNGGGGQGGGVTGQGGANGGSNGSAGSNGSGGQSGAGGARSDAGLSGTGGSSTDASPDATTAANPGGYIAGGGCDCSLPGAPARTGWVWLLALGAIAWTRRRRR